MTQNQPKVNVWWKPVSPKIYDKIGQMGEVTFVVRIIPGLRGGNIYEPICEKDTSTSMYPNSNKWLIPVLVLNDPLDPANNGKVAVYDISKTVKNRIISKATPPNYFDPMAGFNFNIIVSLKQSKDGQSYFPDYTKSHFDNQPSPVDPQYIFSKMNELKILDFADWVNKFNEHLRKKNQPTTQQAQGQGYGYVNPAATTPPVAYNYGQTVPVNNVAVPPPPVGQNNNVAWSQPTQPAQVPPAAAPATPNYAQFAPPPASATQPKVTSDDFNDIFGVPNDNDIPF